ncbi:MAG: gamma-glutamyltransferase family protein [Burkholderiaceae bacterium]|nr:gamma-glutamyltransferase family protein [Burkholderiaceae bacterium]
MVTSPHDTATQIGLDILRSGGNAVEAAIAIGASLNVTYPHFSGFGGDGFMIIRDRAGAVRTISGIGQAPLSIPSYAGAVPTRGPTSMLTSAGGVDALGKAFDISQKELGGKKSWAELLAPAARLAAEGFEVTPSEVFWSHFRMKDAQDIPALAGHFSIAGQAPQVGDIFRQPQLAETIEALAVRGHRDFYEGRLASRIAKGLEEAGSPLRAADLAHTHARVEAPISVPYRNGMLLSLPPPTQGLTTLEIMGIVDRFDLNQVEEGSADYFHILVEAVKQAFLDRNRYLADPEFASVPIERLLSKAHLDDGARKIRMATALEWPHPFKTGDTVFIAAADAHGNLISMQQTVYHDWGSGVIVGDTGLLWHNRGAAFDLTEGHPNQLQPGKRPFHTLNPGMFIDGQSGSHLLYGTQGADGQPQTLATILTRMIDYQLDPLTALSRPRFLLGKTFSDTRDSLKLEADAGQDVFQELARRGHQLSELPAQSPLAGHPGVIQVNAELGTFRGAHDPRSDGRARGV